jgi:hypothetical protein
MATALPSTATTLESKRPALPRRASFPFTEVKTPRKEGQMELVPRGAYWLAPQPTPAPLLTADQRQLLMDLSLVFGVAISFITLVNALKA